jgi:hypothetical protein
LSSVVYLLANVSKHLSGSIFWIEGNTKTVLGVGVL